VYAPSDSPGKSTGGERGQHTFWPMRGVPGVIYLFPLTQSDSSLNGSLERKNTTVPYQRALNALSRTLSECSTGTKINILEN